LIFIGFFFFCIVFRLHVHFVSALLHSNGSLEGEYFLTQLRHKKILNHKMRTMISRTTIAHILFSAIISGMMSGIVCGVMTWKMAGVESAYMKMWFSGWTTAWPIAFLVIVTIAPFVRKYVYLICACSQPTVNAPQPNSSRDPHPQ